MSNRRKVFGRPGAAHRKKRWVTETFTSTGTWTRPYGVDRVRVLCIGGGGSGNRGVYATSQPGGGGGAGGFSDTWVDVSDLRTVAVTIGGAAGDTTFGTLATGWRGGSSIEMTASGDQTYNNGSANKVAGSGAGLTGAFGIAGISVGGQGNNGSSRTGGGAGGTPTGKSDWTGTTYSTGGAAGQGGNTVSRTGDVGAANTGNGGGGGWYGSVSYPFDSVGGSGGSGVLKVGYWV